MVQIVRDVCLVQVKGGVGPFAADIVGEFQIFGNAIGPGKGAEVMVKGDVFLDDVDEVFDGNVLRVL